MWGFLLIREKMHKISEVIIRNFKSCRDTTLLLSEFTPLVGYNNAGKSNCLSAIQWLIRRASLSDKIFMIIHNR